MDLSSKLTLHLTQCTIDVDKNMGNKTTTFSF